MKNHTELVVHFILDAPYALAFWVAVYLTLSLHSGTCSKFCLFNHPTPFTCRWLSPGASAHPEVE